MEKLGRFLDIVDDHKDDIVSLLWVTGTLAAVFSLPAPERAEVLKSASYAALIAATGFGVAVSRLSKGGKEYFLKNKNTDGESE